MTHIAHTLPPPLTLQPTGFPSSRSHPLLVVDHDEPGDLGEVQAHLEPTHRQQNERAIQSAQQELGFRTLEQRTIRRTYVPAFLAGMALGACATIGSVAGGIATDNLALAVGGGLAGMLTLVSSGIGLGCSALTGWHHARRAVQAQERLEREAGLLVLRRQLERVLVVTDEDDRSDVVPVPRHYSIGNATPSAEPAVPLAIGAVAESRSPSLTPPTGLEEI